MFTTTKLCAVCGLDDDACICPVCPRCGQRGGWNCYQFHGMKRTEAQIASRLAMEQEWASRVNT